MTNAKEGSNLLVIRGTHAAIICFEGERGGSWGVDMNGTHTPGRADRNAETFETILSTASFQAVVRDIPWRD
jgi:hypothetical protein